jgi:hypothetical protein
MCGSNRTALGATVIADAYFDTDASGALLALNSAEAIDSYASKTNMVVQAINTGNIAFQKTFSIKLSDFLFDSFWSLDKDIYIARTMFFRITFNQLSKLGFYVNINDNAFVAPFVINAGNNITGLSLLVYKQANENICQIIKAESETEEVIVMPYVWDNTNTTTGQNQSFNFNLVPPNNASDGNSARLYKSYYGLFVQDVPNVGILTNSSNYLQSVAGIVSNKLYTSSVVQQLNGKQLKLLNPDLNEDYADTISQFNTSFRGLVDYKFCGVIASVFDTEMAIKKYDSTTIVGHPFNTSNSISLTHTFTTPAAVTSPLEHHLFAVALVLLYMYKGELSFFPHTVKK